MRLIIGVSNASYSRPTDIIQCDNTSNASSPERFRAGFDIICGQPITAQYIHIYLESFSYDFTIIELFELEAYTSLPPTGSECKLNMSGT